MSLGATHISDRFTRQFESIGRSVTRLRLWRLLGPFVPDSSSHEDASTQPASVLRRNAACRIACVCLITAVAVASPWLLKGRNAIDICHASLIEGISLNFSADDTSFHKEQVSIWQHGGVWLVFADDCMLLLVAFIVIVAEGCWWRRSKHLNSVRCLLLALWVASILQNAKLTSTWCFFPRSPYEQRLHLVMWVVASTLIWLTVILSLRAVCHHLEVLENTFRKPLGARCLKWIRLVFLFTLAVGMVLMLVEEAVKQRFKRAHILVPLAALICSGTILFTLFVGYSRSLSYACEGLTSCTNEQDREVARLAVRSAAWILLEGSFASVALCSREILLVVECFDPSFSIKAVLQLSTSVMVLTAARFVALISGLLMSQGGVASQVSSSSIGCSCSEVVVGVGDLEGPTGCMEWDGKVHELAGRGFTLRALLQFHARLGTEELMGHFSPHLHTTADIVRGAILPASLDGENCLGSSLAECLMKGRPTVPQTMVTHTWSGLWTDLVGTIVADALALPEYGSCVLRLSPEELPALTSELYWKGLLDRTFFLCAISINQHRSICKFVRDCDRDTVTKNLHAVCNCKTPACNSSTPPLRYDGLSISCEMNKFDDVMACVASAQVKSGFRQLIAVDRDFRLFNRAWCVAELHRAGKLQIQQSMCLCSKDSLSQHERALRELRVEDMQASIEADRQLILSKIEDKAAFNAEVQHLIFDKGGLLESWQCGLEMVSALGYFARKGMERHTMAVCGAGWNPDTDVCDGASSCSSIDESLMDDESSGLDQQ